MKKASSAILDEINKTIEGLEKALKDYEETVKEFTKDTTQATKDFDEAIKKFPQDVATYTDEQVKMYEAAIKKRNKAIEKSPVAIKKLNEEEKKIYEKALKDLGEATKRTEKKRKEHGETLDSISKKVIENELLNGEQQTSNMDAIGEKQVEGEKTRTETILELRQRLATSQEELGKVLAKDDSAEKSAEKFTEKWKGISGTIEEVNKSAGVAMQNMFGATTKFIDAEIAHSKVRLTEVGAKLENQKKEVALLAQDSARVLARIKKNATDAIKKEVAGDDSISAGEKEKETTDRVAELDELEFFHKQEAEMYGINLEREKVGNDERAKLTEDQIKRFDELKGKYADYNKSVDEKYAKDREAQNKTKDLEKEKEDLEKRIKKQETQKRRVEAAQQFIQASINIAQGVTKALAGAFPMNIINAAIVGAAGAVQLGVMASQRNKLEDGGLLNGKRHSQGGMRILGSNIEVEGGEYVVNRESTDKNIGLIRYINSQRRALAPSDIGSFFAKSAQGFEPPFRQAFQQGGQLPQMDTSTNLGNELLVQAIESIKFEPKVSVTDINTVQTDVVKVDAWTGM